MTVSMLVNRCNNVRISTRAFIEDAIGRIYHDGNTLTISPEIMSREVSSFTLDNDTLYVIIF